jgi:hypothetical protein
MAKSTKIWDGTAWHDLQGPPGPTVVSADAGNLLTLGSDGLILLRGDTQFSGMWTPFCPELGTYESAEGYWFRAGRLVTLFVLLNIDQGRTPGDVMSGTDFSVAGLPFGVAEFFDSSTSVANALFFAPVCGCARIDGGKLVFGLPVGGAAIDFATQGITINLDKATEDAYPLTVNISYLTDDARIG